MCRLANYQELFNLRHAQARNGIEQIFGIVKRRFPLLIQAPEYPLTTQAQLVPVICALHNFIRTHDPTDEDQFTVGNSGEVVGVSESERPTPSDDELHNYILRAEANRATAKRDQIAKEMWASYQQILEEREEEVN